MNIKPGSSSVVFCSMLLTLFIQGCSNAPPETLPQSLVIEPSTANHEEYRYLIGPGDTLNLFVWQNPEVSTSFIVRPDGMINAPLIDELKASDKTPTQLAREIEAELSQYIRAPLATVTVSGFVGPYNEQVRIIGEAASPQALSYNEDMTLLDVVIRVGGLTPFADGNGVVLARVVDGEYQQYILRVEDLLQDGDLTANVNILPGDIIVIPESWF